MNPAPDNATPSAAAVLRDLITWADKYIEIDDGVPYLLGRYEPQFGDIVERAKSALAARPAQPVGDRWQVQELAEYLCLHFSSESAANVARFIPCAEEILRMMPPAPSSMASAGDWAMQAAEHIGRLSRNSARPEQNFYDQGSQCHKDAAELILAYAPQRQADAGEDSHFTAMREDIQDGASFRTAIDKAVDAMAGAQGESK